MRLCIINNNNNYYYYYILIIIIIIISSSSSSSSSMCTSCCAPESRGTVQWPALAASSQQQPEPLSSRWAPAEVPLQDGPAPSLKGSLMMFPCKFSFYFYSVFRVLKRCKGVLFLSSVPGWAVSVWRGRWSGAGRQELQMTIK